MRVIILALSDQLDHAIHSRELLLASQFLSALRSSLQFFLNGAEQPSRAPAFSFAHKIAPICDMPTNPKPVIEKRQCNYGTETSVACSFGNITIQGHLELHLSRPCQNFELCPLIETPPNVAST